MNTKSKIAIIREKLDLYWKTYIDSSFLQKLLDKFATNYTITNLVSKWLITPIKRWKIYINNKYKRNLNVFVVAWLYMQNEVYVIWWLAVYNRYWFTEQVASRLTIYNTKISWIKKIWPYEFIFKRQRKSFFYWIKTERVWEYKYRIFSTERAFIEFIKEWKNLNYIPKNINKNKLLKMASKYASKKTLKIIQNLISKS